jgi:hypothetical protein
MRLLSKENKQLPALQSLGLAVLTLFASNECRAAPPSRADVAQSIKQFTQPVAYDASDVNLKKLVDGYRAGALYTAIRIETSGVDASSVNQFSCASTSFWHFVTKLFGVTKNQSFMLEAATSIGGYPIPSVPLLVLSDVEGNCKYVVMEARRLIPLTKIDSNTNVEITFVLRRTDSRDFKLIDNFRPVVSSVAAAFGSTNLVSKLAQPVLANAAKSVSDLITNSSLTDVSGQVTTSFDLLATKGLDFAPQGSGTPLHIRLLAEPQLSIYTPETKGVGKDIRPEYPPALNVYSQQGIYSINQNGTFVSMSVRQHFQADTTAHALLARLTASPANDFTDACDAVRDELQSRLRLAEADLLENFFFILQRTHWYDDPAYKNTLCVSGGDKQEMVRLGLPVTSGDLSRADALALMNEFLEKIGVQLHYGTTASKRAYFSVISDPGIEAVDPAGILLTSAKGKDAVVAGLSVASTPAFGCFSTSVDQPPVLRTALAVTKTGARLSFTVDVAKFGAGSKVDDLRAVLLTVIPMEPSDPDATALLTRVRNGQPSPACVALMGKYFTDFAPSGSK